MTTPANNGSHSGANKPEDDDPFGYLYEDGQAAGATPPGQSGYGYPGPAGGGHPGTQPGVPRTSHHQVRTVGDRRSSGGPRGPVPQQAQPSYQAQYQAPEALQAGGYGVPPQQGGSAQSSQTQAISSHGGGHGGGSGGAGRGGGSSRKGLLIAAVAVVAAVVIGIGAALAFGDKGDDKKDKDAANGGQNQSSAPQKPQSPAPSGATQPSEAPLPKADASGAGMSLTGGAGLVTAVPGANSADGQYVGNFNQLGAAVTWTVDLPKDGEYTFRMFYGVPGKDANTTLTVNGSAQGRAINMKNFAKAAEGDWAKGWTNTYSYVNLKKGTNTIKISCEQGNACETVIDRFVLEKR